MSSESLQRRFTKLKEEAKEMANVILLENGIQVKVYDTKFVLTFYYKSETYHFNLSGAMILFKPGHELKVIEKYYLKQTLITDGHKKNYDFFQAPVNRKPIPTFPKVIEITDKGTQACIDHIDRKIIAFQQVNPEKPNHALLAMLKNLKVEFEQYL